MQSRPLNRSRRVEADHLSRVSARRALSRCQSRSFSRGALVVLLLALGEPDFEFGAAVLPVQLERHQRVAAPLDRADQALQLAVR